MKALVRATLVLALFAGCATERKPNWGSADGNVTLEVAEQNKWMAEGKKAWLNRDQEPSLRLALEKFEAVAQGNPRHYEALMLLSRGYFLLGDAHTHDRGEKRNRFEKGLSWGERALAVNEAFRKNVDLPQAGLTQLENGLKEIHRDQVDAIYWTAMNLAQWSNVSGYATDLKYRDQIRVMVRRVEQLDPDYYMGAIYRYWGAYYVETPYLAGGTLQRSLESYKKALKISDKLLANHVSFAENYAVRKRDRKLFERELNLVLKSKPETLSDLVPEQLMAQQRARELLDQAEVLFKR